MNAKKIEFYKHNLNIADKRFCMKVLNSIFLTTGSVVKEFESAFSHYIRLKYTIGVTSCTDALFLALKALDIKSDDEVITTPMSFVATANVIEYCNAIPVFVDVEAETGNIDHRLIEQKITSKTKAILVVHLYGQMCNMKGIRTIADKYNLKVIEDCAHCIEGVRDGVRVGQLADFSCFSFYATKNITSGEGGAISCNKESYNEWLLKARQHGLSKSATDRYMKYYRHYDMVTLGYKCNMSNIQASLLINQLDRIEHLLARKEIISQIYNDGFKKNKFIKLLKVVPNSKHARHLYTILVNPAKRDHYLHMIQKSGIGLAVNFRPIHLMNYYRTKYKYTTGTYPVAELIGASTITLPLYPKLTQKEINRIVDTVNEIVIR